MLQTIPFLSSQGYDECDRPVCLLDDTVHDLMPRVIYNLRFQDLPT